MLELLSLLSNLLTELGLLDLVESLLGLLAEVEKER